MSQVVGQMIDAVEYMHRRGVVHRDIKPENIVLSFDVFMWLCRKLLNYVILGGLGYRCLIA